MSTNPASNNPLIDLPELQDFVIIETSQEGELQGREVATEPVSMSYLGRIQNLFSSLRAQPTSPSPVTVQIPVPPKAPPVLHQTKKDPVFHLTNKELEEASTKIKNKRLETQLLAAQSKRDELLKQKEPIDLKLQQQNTAYTQFIEANRKYAALSPKDALDDLWVFLPTDKSKELKEARGKLQSAAHSLKQTFGENVFMPKDKTTVLNTGLINQSNLALADQLKKINAQEKQIKEEIQSLKAEITALNKPSSTLEVPTEEIQEVAQVVEQPIAVALTPQQQMLSDIENRTHKEIAQMWSALASKFPGEEIIKTWQINEKGEFTIELTKPIALWVPDASYPDGVMLLFGVDTAGMINGSIAQGTLPTNHQSVVQSTISGNKKEFSRSTPPVGMIFNSGVQTFCKHQLPWPLPPIWPKATTTHYLRVGETEDNKNNIVMSGTYLGNTEGRLKSLAQITKNWEAGIAIPNPQQFESYLRARVAGKPHDQAIKS